MLPWQRRARLAVAAIGIACAIAAFITTRPREAPPVQVAVPRADPKAVVESTGAVVRQVKGAKENFRIEADRQLTYAGGQTKLQGVTITVGREGRTFVVTGREAEVGQNESEVTLTGAVRIAASDGLTATTDAASYTEGDGIVRAPGPVTFERGRLAGKGLGMTYDRNRDVLWLLDQAVVTFAPDAAGTGRIEVTSGTAGLARREKYLRFERSVRIVRDGQVMVADEVMAYFSDDESHLTSIELRGRSRISTGETAPGALKGMAARDINLEYAEDGEHVQHAGLAGGAAMQMAGEKGGRDRRISAESLDMDLAPDGTTLTALTGHDRVVVDLPSEHGQPARIIRATMLVGAGEPGRGLTAATFTENVEYRENRSAPPVQRLVRSQVLATTLGGGFADIQDARFSGGVRFDDMDVHATAAAARYLVGKGVVELTGDIGNTSPRVANEQITVDAKRIELTLDGPKMSATQAVRSILQPAKAATGSAGAPTRMPGLMQQDQPVYVTGDALQYDGGLSQAIYTGHARMWQGDTAVQGETLNLDGRSGDLTATGDVRSALTLEQINDKTHVRETIASIASAHDLHYEDSMRKATYRTEAHVNGPQGDLRAKTIELYLGGTNGRDLERVEGYDDVSLRQDLRSATGTRLTYFSGEGRYVMGGAPVRVVEECRETTGKLLTFFRSTDRILVDGNEEIRTQTKSGGDCPGPRFD